MSPPSGLSVRNFDNSDPAAPAGATNCLWQLDAASDPQNISSYLPLFIGDDDPSSPIAAPAAGAVPAPAVGDAALGKFLAANGTWEVPAGAGGGTPQREAPAGTLNGTNTVFTLSFTPNPVDSLLLFLNGVAQNPGSGSPLAGADYSISGVTITFTVPPVASDWMMAFYSH
jgi:hypothetical protein